MTLPTVPPLRFVPRPALRAARSGVAIHRHVNELATLTAAYVVQTSALLYYNIPAGHQVVVSGIDWGLHTHNDSLYVRMVKTQFYAGVGDEVIIGRTFYYHSGAANVVRLINNYDFIPRLIVKHSAGLTCVSMEAKVNDTDAIATIGWHGWVEKEST